MFKGSLLVFILSLAPLLEVGTALANDSEAALEAGGLVLKKSDGIVMEQEELYLSKDEVRVRYIFENQSAQDIHTIVAFPIAKPGYELDEAGQPIADPQLAKDLNFKVWVQGKSVPTKIERKIERKKTGYLDRATFYWEQIFPAQQKLEVRHSYRPGLGAFFFDPVQDHYQSIKQYCMEPSLVKALIPKAQQSGGLIPAFNLYYILSTGNNWRGPIKSFEMILDKGDPKTLVSLCMNGIKKIGPTQFEVVQENFSPQQDLQIVFFGP